MYVQLSPWFSRLLGRQGAVHPRVVAVLRFGAAGDVVRCAPAIEALARAWPAARIVVVTHARCAPLLAGLRVPVHIMAFAQGGTIGDLAAQLRRAGVTDVLDLHGSMRARLLCLRLWPRKVVRWQKRSWAEWARVRLAHAPHHPEATCAARQQVAVQALTGDRVALPPLRLRPLPTQPAAPSAQRRVGLSPGAAWATKRWPTARWGALARALTEAGVHVDIFGSDAERPLAAAICRVAPSARDRSGLSWSTLTSDLQSVGAFVCGDSGPLHLAMALGVPCVGLFFSTSAGAYDSVATQALTACVPCQPCSFFGRPSCPRGHLDCVTQLGVAPVLAAVQRLLDSPPGHPGADDRNVMSTQSAQGSMTPRELTTHYGANNTYR